MICNKKLPSGEACGKSASKRQGKKWYCFKHYEKVEE